MSKASDDLNKKIYFEALEAGMAAGSAPLAIEPMVLSDGKTTYFVADGVCGFGWVHFSGGTSFGKWAKKLGFARSDYPTGLAISSKLMTQSMARNEAFADAFAKVLNANGIPATSRSRID
jgi:hypothetical protein